MASSPNVPAVAQTSAIGTKKDLEAMLQSDQFKNAVGLALPKHLPPERFVRIALNAFMRTPELLKCTQASVFRCLLDLSALGLEPDGRRAHLIPFKTECTLIVDYKGLIELMMRSPEVSNVYPDVVCENDDFEFDRGKVVRHVINFKQPRGKVYAAYARVEFRDGRELATALSLEELERIRGRSKAKDNGPWKTDTNEMYKKTAVRRLSKIVPWDPEKQARLDEADDDRIEEVVRTREHAVVDLGMFQASLDANRGHGAEVPHVSESELKDQVEQKRAAVQKMHDALPNLEAFPEPGDYRPGDKVKVRGDIWLRALEGSTTEWEPWRAE